MADVDVSSGAKNSTNGEGGVLANLPRTRPQRSSARRTAARRAVNGNGAGPHTVTRRPRKPAEGKRQTSEAEQARPAKTRDSAASAQAKAAAAARGPGSPRARRASSGKRQATPLHRPVSPEDPAPSQGYDCEGAGGSVQPPGGPELVASAAEIVSELAKAGLSAGERLLKDVFARLPGS